MHTIFGLVYLAAYIYIIYWVYTDASKRGMNAILWAILTFLFCPITPIIYFFIRKSPTV